MIRSEDIRSRVKDLEMYLIDDYKRSKNQSKRDWRTYEHQLLNRIKGAIKNLEPLIENATKFEIYRKKGGKPSLNPKQKVIILLLKELFGTSNRMMASMLMLFSLLSEIDVGYKTIERLYSDEEVEMSISQFTFPYYERGKCEGGRRLWRWNWLFFNDKTALCI